MIQGNKTHQHVNAAINDCSCSHDLKEGYEQLLKGNLNWAETTSKEDPDFFNQLAKGQSPEVLWIGCSDSRAPASLVTGTKAGEIFEHRNIANLCINSDLNMLSVLDYAVSVLKVKHIIVAGHYGCGGVTAALSNKQFGMIDNWLRHIKDVYRLHSAELDQITNDQEKLKRLVEINVGEQVSNICRSTIVQNAWSERPDLQVHGWVMDLATGLVKDLDVTSNGSKYLPEIYHLTA